MWQWAREGAGIYRSEDGLVEDAEDAEDAENAEDAGEQDDDDGRPL